MDCWHFSNHVKDRLLLLFVLRSSRKGSWLLGNVCGLTYLSLIIRIISVFLAASHFSLESVLLEVLFDFLVSSVSVIDSSSWRLLRLVGPNFRLDLLELLELPHLFFLGVVALLKLLLCLLLLSFHFFKVLLVKVLSVAMKKVSSRKITLASWALRRGGS